MSQLILPARFNKQPQSTPEIDWSNSLTKKLELLVVGSHKRDIINGNNAQSSYLATTVDEHGTAVITGPYSNGVDVYPSNLPPGNATIFMLLKMGGVNNADGILELGNVNATNAGFAFKTTLSGPVQMRVFANSSSANVYALDPATLVLGETYFYVGTWDGSTLRLYRNGNLVASTSFSGPVYFASPNFEIGAGGGNSSASPNRLYLSGWHNRALSGNEVAQLSANPWQIFHKRRRLFFVTASGVSASAAQTDGADTQAATATPIVTTSAAQTDGADTQVANASVGTAVSASAAQTDGADTQAATATPIVTASAAQTDGADTQSAHAGPITGVAASAAQTDGADTQAATATPLIVASATQTDGTDIQVATVYVAFIDANLADLFACQQAAVSQYYTGSKPTPLNFQVFITSGSWTVPTNTTTVYVSATAAGGSPFGGAGQQVLKQQLKAVAGDTVSVAIGQTVAVSVNGAQQLFLNPGGAYGKFQAQAWGQSSYIQGFGNGADTGSGDPALSVILWS